ncbi:hypothetical protein [Citrobacter portucalensis]|uniref:hypothetical protein n=1 Tax=Citrobacter portucalensis TaxID=1639133 RepID=UPI001299DDE2|nr:hypothetical protein [Citrobacter portucalensis]MRF57623.1 hypothetical protein [Citrobacter portucalensis]
MKKLLEDAFNDLSKAFFLRAEVLRDVTDMLPFQLRKVAVAAEVSLDGRNLLFIASSKLSAISANNFLNIRRVVDVFDIPVVVVASNIDHETMAFFKHNHIGCIVPGKVSYIPSLLMNYNNINSDMDYKMVGNDKPFSIISSYILAYHLSGELPRFFNSLYLVEIFDVSKMAISRALNELLSQEIIYEIGNTRPKVFEFSIDRKLLWLKYKHRISSLSTSFIPVQTYKLEKYHFFVSGESALSIYSDMLPPDQKQIGIYLSAEDRRSKPITPATIESSYFFKELGFWDGVNSALFQSEKIAFLQIFPYLPVLKKSELNKDTYNTGVLNKVFLALSKFNKSDVRIRSSFIELETEIMNEFKY